MPAGSLKCETQIDINLCVLLNLTIPPFYVTINLTFLFPLSQTISVSEHTNMKILIALLPVLGVFSVIAALETDDAVQPDAAFVPVKADFKLPHHQRVTRHSSFPTTGVRGFPRPLTLPKIETPNEPQTGPTRFVRSPEPFRAPPPRGGGQFKLPPGVNPTFPKF